MESLKHPQFSGRKKTRKERPWLTPDGVEIPTGELKEISKNWDLDTWERYLKWYESGRREKLARRSRYFEALAEQQTQTVFEQFNQDTDPKNRALCERLLSLIPETEATVLRLTFFSGRTVREIAAQTGYSKSGVHRLKNKALSRLKRGHGGDTWDTRRTMRGAKIDLTSSIWLTPLSFPIKEERVYEPKKCQQELANIKHAALRLAVAKLSEREQRILYLRFWCDLSVSEIAKTMNSGVNLIEQVLEATISKLKRKVCQFETGHSPEEGGPSCA